MKIRITTACIYLASTICVYAAECPTTTFLPIHSQGCNNMRTLAGSGFHSYLNDAQAVYTSFTAIPEYTKTFRPERIVQCLFGTDIIKCENTLTIAGSQHPERTRSDWLADYFGLPPDFKSCMRFEPHVEEFLTNFSFFAGYKNVYALIQTPVVRTKWNLNYCEDLCISGTTAYPEGYFSTSEVSRGALLNRATDFFSNTQTPDFTDTQFESLRHARMSAEPQSETACADVHFFLGYSFLNESEYHVSTHLCATVPTGTKPSGTFLFEPIVGNGRHPELGAGIAAHWQGINPENEYETIRIDTQLDMTHLFRSCQQRSFDLVDKRNSRYMLAQKMSSSVNELTGPPGSDPIDAQFDGTYTPVANLTTCPVWVHNALQVDFSLLFTYLKDDASWAFGYGLWARSKDRMRLDHQCITPNTWALKGDAQLFGFPADSSPAVALSATQQEATIDSGTNSNNDTNTGVDNPVAAYKNNVTPLYNAPGSGNVIATSLQPIMLSDADIDISSAITRGFAHKIAFHFNKTWFPSRQVTTSIGLGAEVEFGNRHYTACNRAEKILNSALSHWGVWAKAIITFM